ncbi:MAG: cupin domain-containing protein [Halanaerobiales bacterium]|nr:cupin domain-containing protein [Halanaerobiales bacterium]
MNVIKLDKLKSEKNMKGIMTKDVLKNENVQVKNLLLEKGDVVPEHKVPVDVFFHVIEGKGTIQIGDTEYELEEKDFITCPPNTIMKVMANKGESFNILNVKTPSMK